MSYSKQITYTQYVYTNKHTHKHTLMNTKTHVDDSNILTHAGVMKYLGAQLLGIFNRVQMTGPESTHTKFSRHTKNKNSHCVCKHVCKSTLNPVSPV